MDFDSARSRKCTDVAKNRALSEPKGNVGGGKREMEERYTGMNRVVSPAPCGQLKGGMGCPSEGRVWSPRKERFAGFQASVLRGILKGLGMHDTGTTRFQWHPSK